MSKLNKERIQKLLLEINNGLTKKQIRGEIALYGGAVMLLVFDARDCTKDIDAIFSPKDSFKQVINDITTKYNLDDGWLNDGIKGFIDSNKGLKEYKRLSNLIIYVANAEYMLAMKCHASRVEPDSNDRKDIKFLIKYLKLKTSKEVLDIVGKYIPRDRIQVKTQYFVEEILEEIKNSNSQNNITTKEVMLVDFLKKHFEQGENENGYLLFVCESCKGGNKRNVEMVRKVASELRKNKVFCKTKYNYTYIYIDERDEKKLSNIKMKIRKDLWQGTTLKTYIVQRSKIKIVKVFEKINNEYKMVGIKKDNEFTVLEEGKKLGYTKDILLERDVKIEYGGIVAKYNSDVTEAEVVIE